MKSTLFLLLKTLLYNFQKFWNSHLEWKTKQLNGPGNYRELRETGPRAEKGLRISSLPGRTRQRHLSRSGKPISGQDLLHLVSSKGNLVPRVSHQATSFPGSRNDVGEWVNHLGKSGFIFTVPKYGKQLGLSGDGGQPCRFLKYKRLKMTIRVFLVGHSVAMVTYCVTKITPTCSPVNG